MDTTRVLVIGVGGVGQRVLGDLARYLSFDEQEPELVLIDGDEYELGNANRQAFERLGNKAMVTAERLRDAFPNLLIRAIPAFIGDEHTQARHAEMTVISASDLIEEGDTVFLCVDNHATRLLVSRYMQSLQNGVLISGGNEWSDGNVQVFIRRNGEDLTPTIEQYHSEIASPVDVPPYQMSCEELAAAGAPQLIFANLMVASLMLSIFWLLLEQPGEEVAPEVFFDMGYRKDEVIGPAVVSHSRPK